MNSFSKNRELSFLLHKNEKFMRDDQDGPATQCPPIARTDTDKVKNSKWKPVLLPLNPNFLRLTNERNDDFSDEFAVMLQNEEFLAELR